MAITTPMFGHFVSGPGKVKEGTTAVTTSGFVDIALDSAITFAFIEVYIRSYSPDAGASDITIGTVSDTVPAFDTAMIAGPKQILDKTAFGDGNAGAGFIIFPQFAGPRKYFRVSAAGAADDTFNLDVRISGA